MQTAIIIPCYNESLRLQAERFIEFALQNSKLHLVFVNDGSTDNTLEILKSMEARCSERIKVIDLEKNSGKAEAVRLSMLKLHESGDYTCLGYLDADLATPLDELVRMTDYFFLQSPAMLMGMRLARLGAKVERSNFRHYLGRVFATLASSILKLQVYDTQCGAKLFSNEIIPVCFGDKFITSWIFDVEIIARIRNRYSIDFCKDNIVEFPLQRWVETGGSKLRLKHYLKVPFNLLAIHRKYN